MSDVLIVDASDDDAELSLLSLRQGMPRLRTHRVKDAEQGWQYLRRTGIYALRWDADPRLVICDFQMPGMNGLQLLKRVRAHSQTSTLPFVLFSSATNPLVAEVARSLGAQAFLSKPIDPSAYRQRVLSMVGWLAPLTKNTIDDVSVSSAGRAGATH